MIFLFAIIVVFWSCDRQGDFLKEQQQLLQTAFQPQEKPHFIVWAFTSSDGHQWTRKQQPIAYGFTSLGLTITEELRLSGQHRLRLPTKAEEKMGLLWTQSLIFDGKKMERRYRDFSGSQYYGTCRSPMV